MRLHPLALRRARAYARDSLGYLGIAVLEVPLGLVVLRLGWGHNHALLAALSSVPPIIATALAARAESRSAGATWGKRAEGLQVTAPSGSPTLARAIERNTAKIFVPWTLGHMVAFGAARGGFNDNDPLTLVSASLIYPLLGIMAVMTATGSGRAPYDRLAHTQVVTAGACDTDPDR